MEKITEKKIEFTEISGWLNTVSAKEKALLYEHISNLMEGGVSIIGSLDSFIGKTSNQTLAITARNLQYFVSNGDPLSVAMKKLPQVFEKYEAAIVEAGENSGKVQVSLRELSGELRKSYELGKQIQNALTYPTIIMLFLVAAVIIVMTFVVPSLLPLFENLNEQLPFSTRMLLGTSSFVTENWLFVSIILILGGVGFAALKNSRTGNAALDRFVLGLPLIGEVYKNYILSRIAANLSLLLGGGISVVKTIQLVGVISNNALYESALTEVAELVSQGNKISSSLEKVNANQLFTLDFIQMIDSGERTSTVNVVARKLSSQYEQEVSYSLANMLKWIEPIAVLVAGIFVVWFAFSIFGAIIQITQGVSNI